jgi:Tfp pilus assembly protein PilE
MPLNEMDMKNNKGFALIFSLILSTIIVAIIASLAAIASGDLTLAAKTTNNIRAYYMAEAGLAKKYIDIRNGNFSSINGTITYTGSNLGTFTANVVQTAGGVFPTYDITAVGTYKSVSKTLRLTVRQFSYSRYIYLTNRETRDGVRIWFIGGDIVRGPLHTNGQLNIYNDPTFEGPVSSVSTSINYYHGPPPEDNPDFQETLTLGAPYISLPTSAELITSVRTASQQADGVYLTGDSVITLLSDGTMRVTNNDQDWENHIMPIPANGALYVDSGRVYLSGVLSGVLTVATNNNIYITNNILYASDPRTNPESGDTLGLVSQNNVIISSSAPYNLEIDAYIIALNESFYLQNYTYGLKGTLTLYGGITQVERGPVGTFNASTGAKASGYTKDYVYDERFEDSAPAFFPPARDSDGRIVYLKTRWMEL